jgi:uncharacterized Zn finger protein (UPF0148 family)
MNCPKCGSVKSKYKSGRLYCRPCTYKRNAAYRRANANLIKSYHDSYRQQHAAKKTKQESARVQSSIESWLYHKLQTAKQKRQVAITHQDLLNLYQRQNGVCAITGLQLSHAHNNPLSASIDRIDSNKEYCDNNIQLVCQSINLGKRNFSNLVVKSLIAEMRGGPISILTTTPTSKRSKYESSPRRFLLLRLIRTRERRKHDSSELTTEFLHHLWNKQHGLCAITNLPFTHRLGDIKAVSIDRIDSNLAYTKDNIQLVIYFANLAKRNFLDEHVKKFFKAVIDTDL